MGRNNHNMRLAYLILSIVLSLVGCTSNHTVEKSTPESRVVELYTEQATLSLRTLPGWLAYTEDNNIILSSPTDVSHALVVNVWLPDVSSLPTQASVTEILDAITADIQTRRSVAVSAPISTQWGDHEAAYFLINSDRHGLTMIVTANVDDTFIALNISAVSELFSESRVILQSLFADFAVNDTTLGGDIFTDIPNVLRAPSLNPEAALEGSSEP